MGSHEALPCDQQEEVMELVCPASHLTHVSLKLTVWLTVTWKF